MTTPSRNPPSSIKLQLRQESNFGCAVCGCPILEYHHIIRWEECKSHDVENLVALCPTHHTLLGKDHPDEAKNYKLNPYNKSKKGIQNKFVNQCVIDVVKLGRMYFHKSDPILQAYDKELLAVKSCEGRIEIDALFPDSNFLPDLQIQKNNFNAKTQGMYDVEFRGNYLRVRKLKGKNYITIDLRKDMPEIYFDIEILGQRHYHTQKKSSVSSFLHVSPNGRLNIKGGSGILIGNQNSSILPVNHAARRPKPTLKENFGGDLKNFAINFQSKF